MYKGTQKQFALELKEKTLDSLRKLVRTRENAIDNLHSDLKYISKEKKEAWSKFIAKTGDAKKTQKEKHKELADEQEDAKQYKLDLEKEIDLIQKEISSRSTLTKGSKSSKSSKSSNSLEYLAYPSTEVQYVFHPTKRVVHYHHEEHRHLHNKQHGHIHNEEHMNLYLKEREHHKGELGLYNKQHGPLQNEDRQICRFKPY